MIIEISSDLSFTFFGLGFLGSVVGAIIGGAASIGSALLGHQGQSSANEMAADESEANRAWQERMSSTAHQREVEDLKKAGLNPILSAFNTGASTPKGSQASFANPYAQATEAAAGVNSALRMMTLETEKLQMEKDLAAATADRERSQTDLNRTSDRLADENIKVATEQWKTQQTQQALNSAASLKALEEINTTKAQANAFAASAARDFTQSQLNSAEMASVLQENIIKEVDAAVKKANQPHQERVAGIKTYLDLVLDLFKGGKDVKDLTRRTPRYSPRNP